MIPMKHYKVVAAIIMHCDKILCVQRGNNKFDYISNKYEFPGGKIEPGESKVEAITREIIEELNMKIIVQDEYLTVQHKYPDFELTMYSFICSVVDDKLILTEHVAYKWLYKHELNSLDWAEADVPIVKNLMNA
jgi:8-oxo-dGTP diphosphatase